MSVYVSGSMLGLYNPKLAKSLGNEIHVSGLCNTVLLQSVSTETMFLSTDRKEGMVIGRGRGGFSPCARFVGSPGLWCVDHGGSSAEHREGYQVSSNAPSLGALYFQSKTQLKLAIQQF